tara:strand:+ start:47 stop:568 length:522 start_codon:yes stop_codon:yes gene_type:complete
MQNEIKKFNWKISCNKEINVSVDRLWGLITRPSNLELFHPFCKKNPIRQWPGSESIDEVHYYNGLILKRTFINWIDNEGYDLCIAPKSGSKSFVSWRIKKITEKSSNIKIIVYPYLHNKGSKAKCFIPFNILIKPILKKYLYQVLSGIEWHLNNNKRVPKNKFGNNIMFSNSN